MSATISSVNDDNSIMQHDTSSTMLEQESTQYAQISSQDPAPPKKVPASKAYSEDLDTNKRRGNSSTTLEEAKLRLTATEYEFFIRPVHTLNQKEKKYRRTLHNRLSAGRSRKFFADLLFTTRTNLRFMKQYVNYLHCVIGRLDGFESSLETGNLTEITQDAQDTSNPAPVKDCAFLNNSKLTPSLLKDFWIDPADDQGTFILPRCRADLLVGLEMEKKSRIDDDASPQDDDSSMTQLGDDNGGNEVGSSLPAEQSSSIKSTKRIERKSRPLAEPAPLRRSARVSATQSYADFRDDDDDVDDGEEEEINAHYKSREPKMDFEQMLHTGQTGQQPAKIKRQRTSRKLTDYDTTDDANRLVSLESIDENELHQKAAPTATTTTTTAITSPIFPHSTDSAHSTHSSPSTVSQDQKRHTELEALVQDYLTVEEYALWKAPPRSLNAKEKAQLRAIKNRISKFMSQQRKTELAQGKDDDNTIVHIKKEEEKGDKEEAFTFPSINLPIFTIPVTNLVQQDLQEHEQQQQQQQQHPFFHQQLQQMQPRFDQRFNTTYNSALCTMVHDPKEKKPTTLQEFFEQTQRQRKLQQEQHERQLKLQQDLQKHLLPPILGPRTNNNNNNNNNHSIRGSSNLFARPTAPNPFVPPSNLTNNNGGNVNEGLWRTGAHDFNPSIPSFPLPHSQSNPSFPNHQGVPSFPTPNQFPPQNTFLRPGNSAFPMELGDFPSVTSSVAQDPSTSLSGYVPFPFALQRPQSQVQPQTQTPSGHTMNNNNNNNPDGW